jgi:hypothetical protein
MNPKPRPTWQVSIPAFTVTAACAGISIAGSKAKAIPAADAARSVFLSMSMCPCCYRLTGAHGTHRLAIGEERDDNNMFVATPLGTRRFLAMVITSHSGETSETR